MTEEITIAAIIVILLTIILNTYFLAMNFITAGIVILLSVAYIVGAAFLLIGSLVGDELI